MAGKLDVAPISSRQSTEDNLSAVSLVTGPPHLTAVLPSFPVAGADEDVRDVLPEAGLLVHGLALRVVNDGQVHLL